MPPSSLVPALLSHLALLPPLKNDPRLVVSRRFPEDRGSGEGRGGEVSVGAVARRVAGIAVLEEGNA